MVRALENKKSQQTKRAPEVLLSTRGGPFPGVSRDLLRRRAQKMIAHMGLVEGGDGAPIELSIALVSDSVIRELNRSFRHKDKPTDVLAFPMSDAPKADFPSAGRGAPGPTGAATTKGRPSSGLLGDVILSVDTARRQAEANHKPLASELTMLLAHGLLHLLGYDHQTDDEEREMTALTRSLEEASTRPLQRGAGRPKKALAER